MLFRSVLGRRIAGEIGLARIIRIGRGRHKLLVCPQRLSALGRSSIPKSRVRAGSPSIVLLGQGWGEIEPRRFRMLPESTSAYAGLTGQFYRRYTGDIPEIYRRYTGTSPSPRQRKSWHTGQTARMSSGATAPDQTAVAGRNGESPERLAQYRIQWKTGSLNLADNWRNTDYGATDSESNNEIGRASCRERV